MCAWGKRQNRSNPQGTRLRFESLERRDMMSGNYVYTLTSGNTVSFTDDNGTKVNVKLMGAGSGSFSLTNGLQNGAPIAGMTITGTNSASQLKITASGGADGISTIRTLTVTPGSGSTALSQLSTSSINVASGGLFTFNGNVGNMTLNQVNNGAAIDVNGNVNSLIINQSIGSNASIDVSGTLGSMKVQNLGVGSGIASVYAGTLSSLTVNSQMSNGLVQAGAGGLTSAYIQNAYNSAVSAAGNIGTVLVQGTIVGTSFGANRSPGSDGLLGTIDDYTIIPGASAASASIGVVTVKGAVGAGVEFISTGTVATPMVPAGSVYTEIENASSRYIALDIAQAVASTTGFDDDEIWIALYGQEHTTGPTYFLDKNSLNPASGGGQPTPRPLATSTLSTGTNTADQAILPSSTIVDWYNAASPWLSNLQVPVPQKGKHFSGRILISVGAPVQAQITTANGTVAAPSASNPLDPSTGTFYDFLEFTVTHSKEGVVNLDINTSQIDSFGLPMTMQLYQDSAGTDPFTITFTGSPNAGHKTITGVSSLNGLQVGQIVSGTGIQPGSMITSIDAGNSTITLSLEAIAPAAGTSTQISALIGGPVGIDASVSANLTRQDLFDPSNSKSLINYLQGLPSPGKDLARPFLQSAAPFAFNSNLTITSVDNPGSGQPIVVTVSSVGSLQNGDVVEISGVTSIPNANGYFVVSSVTSTTFTLENSAGGSAANASGGNWTGYTTGPRLVSPKDIVEALSSPSSTNQLNNYFNEAIDDFFLKYLPANDPHVSGGLGHTFSITSSASGSLRTYTGQVQQVGALGYVLLLQSSYTAAPYVPFAIFYPFTNSNLPTGYTPKFPTVDAPNWLIKQNMQNQSPSQMIFACDAFFADNTFRLANGQKDKVTFSSTWSAELADLENSIASAFNRGVVLESPSTWGDETQWFQQGNGQNGQYNYWAEYWHNGGVTIDTLSYAYPYDDKYGRSTTLNVNGVGLIEVSLGTWSATQQPTTTTITSITPTTPPPTQQGTVTLTANVGPAVSPHPLTGTVMFFIDGVPINSNTSGVSTLVQQVAVNGSGNAIITATLPPLPDGSVTHTYTVTAVYSGDQYTAPSVATQSLKLIGVNGDFLMNVTPASPTPNSLITVNTTLPGGVYNGTLAYWMGSNLLGVVDVGGANISTILTIPPSPSVVSGPNTLRAIFTPLSGGPYNASVQIQVG